MIHTYIAKRRLEMAPAVWREPGELVPEAHGWFRIESYLNAGYLGETDVSEAELGAAIEAYCPDDADTIRELAGLGDAVLEGLHRTPRVYATKAPAKKAPAKKAASKEG